MAPVQGGAEFMGPSLSRASRYPGYHTRSSTDPLATPHAPLHATVASKHFSRSLIRFSAQH